MPRSLFFRLALLLGLASWTASAAEPPSAALPSREERLSRLARLWGQVRYRHPFLASQDIDWDGALVAALPRVEAARDRAAYAAAVQQLLEVLEDPATRLQRPDEEDGERSGPAVPLRAPRSWEARTTLVLDLRALDAPGALAELRAGREALRGELGLAKAVIIDLRGRGLSASTLETANTALDEVLPLLLTQALPVPGERSLLHSGYRPQTLTSSGDFSTSLVTSMGETVAPQGEGKPRPVLFLLDDRSRVGPRVLAMKAQGLAQLVTEGRLDDGASVRQLSMDMGGGVKVRVRLSERGLPVRADAVLPRRARAEGKDETLQKALELARKPVRKVRAREAELPPVRWRPDRSYADMLYPSREYRLLALFRFWNVIQLFYPYKGLLDKDWDEALTAFLPRFDQAKNAAEYALAVAELSTRLQDGHIFLRGHPELEKRGLGGLAAPFELMDLEGKPVVMKVLDAEAAPGLARGQVVETLDGKPLGERLDALRPYVTAAHPVALRQALLDRAMSGAEGSQGTLGVRDAAGQLKEVRFTRGRASFQKTPPGEPWRLVGSIGYVDLTRLRVAEVPTMFEKLKTTQAIVFDLRGYPQRTAWTLAPYLNVRKARFGSVLERNLVSAEPDVGRFKFFQELPTADVPVYRGRTVMLVDERTISQAEHTGLFLEAVNGTVFVGSPSAGTNGDITDLVLPGGLSVVFTGHDVRHADGRQLQRVGLVPQVRVRPTLAGVQAGRDEVLDKALEYLKNGTLTMAGDAAR